jgi:hypothetical protein
MKKADHLSLEELRVFIANEERQLQELKDYQAKRQKETVAGNLEIEFKTYMVKAQKEFAEKIAEVNDKIEELEELSEKYGVPILSPFHSDLTRTVYTPVTYHTFHDKFGELEDFYDSLYEYGFASGKEYNGWTSSQVC